MISWAGKSEIPRRISAGGRKDLIRFLTNESRAQGSKDLTKQQGLPSIFLKLLLLLLLFLLLLLRKYFEGNP